MRKVVLIIIEIELIKMDVELTMIEVELVIMKVELRIDMLNAFYIIDDAELLL